MTTYGTPRFLLMEAKSVGQVTQVGPVFPVPEIACVRSLIWANVPTRFHYDTDDGLVQTTRTSSRSCPVSTILDSSYVVSGLGHEQELLFSHLTLLFPRLHLWCYSFRYRACKRRSFS